MPAAPYEARVWEVNRRGRAVPVLEPHPDKRRSTPRCIQAMSSVARWRVGDKPSTWIAPGWPIPRGPGRGRSQLEVSSASLPSQDVATAPVAGRPWPGAFSRGHGILSPKVCVHGCTAATKGMISTASFLGKLRNRRAQMGCKKGPEARARRCIIDLTENRG